jgi:pyruvate/2-oxoglutarate dehydrogenase complex dihydrolipoamide dehydrogenase (E3) component
VTHYDAIVIGAGQAGPSLAAALAGSGRKTAIIEREHVGGSCINYGCTPTKTMVASARVAYLARRAADYGVRTGDVSVDMARVRERKRAIVESFRGGSQSRLEGKENLDLIFGEARFTTFGEARFIGPRSVEVQLREGGTSRMEADIVFINTGTRPARPPIPGLDSVPALDNTSIMELDQLPEHLIVLGGGYVGLEFGQMFRRFGARVTMIQSGSQVLPREDSDIAEEVAGIIRGDGIDLHVDTRAERIGLVGEGAIRVAIASGSGQKSTLDGSHLLVAVGRQPNSDALNLESAGIELDPRGYIPVNDRLETEAPGVYALGDINGGPAQTHVSYDDFRIVKANLIDGGNASRKDRLIPYTVFIDPQLGRVGLTETDARKLGRGLLVEKIPMDWVARALELDETRGVMKAVIDKESGQILGAAVLGIEGGEVMAAIQTAMWGKLPYTVLRDGIFAHPTLAEAFNTLFGGVEDV